MADEEKCKCNCFFRFQSKLKSLYFKLGHVIAENPSHFIVVPVLVSVLLATGIQRVRVIDHPEEVFYPYNGQAAMERQVTETLFPPRFATDFEPSRAIIVEGVCRVYVSAKDGGSVLRMSLWKEIAALDRRIRNLTVAWQDQQTLSYEDICAKYNGHCLPNTILDLEEYMPDIESGLMPVNYPTMVIPFVLPHFWGGVDVDEESFVLRSAKFMTLSYWLKYGTEDDKERSLAFEHVFIEDMHHVNLSEIDIVFFSGHSIQEEIIRNLDSALKLFPAAAVVLVVFCLLDGITNDWVRGKPLVNLLGCANAVLATGASFGLLMYLGAPTTRLNLIAIFLIQGIGMDDMFVILSAWRKTHLEDPVPKRLAETYRNTAVSITITTASNAIMFFVGTLTPIFVVSNFCLYTGLAIVFVYVWCLTFFGACLAVVGHLEAQQRHSVCCIVVKPKSVAAKTESRSYMLLKAGGINPEDPSNPLDHQPSPTMMFLREKLGGALGHTWVKGVILLGFAAYLGVSAYGCTQVVEGIRRHNLPLEDSYLREFIITDDTYFRKFPYVIQVILRGNITYSDPLTKEKLLDLHHQFEDLRHIADRDFMQSWIRGFYGFLDRSNISLSDIDEEGFISILQKEYLFRGNTPRKLDVVLNENKTRIVASRILIQSMDVLNTREDVDMMLDLRRVAEASSFDITVYSPLFTYFDMYKMVKPITIQSVGIAVVMVILVSIVLLPNAWCCIFIVMSILSIEIGLVGIMALWDITLDQISMIILIMSVGFSVDFSAHMSYAYLAATGTAKQRLKTCVYEIGLPILQGGISTFVSIAVFAWTPSYPLKIFVKLGFVLAVSSMMHGLLLIPIILSVFGPGSDFHQSLKSNNSETKTDSSVCELPEEKMKPDSVISGDEIKKYYVQEQSSQGQVNEAYIE